MLDMDGTLLSSFTPRRAPVLPPGSIAYVVGRGGRLNPNGVFVVERPGLLAFFQRLSEFAGAAQALHLCVQSSGMAEEPLDGSDLASPSQRPVLDLFLPARALYITG